MSTKPDEAQTFLQWALCEVDTDECLHWPFAKDRDGYGQVWWVDRKRGVHVISCEVAHGSRPIGMESAHSCHVPDCINPRHLSWKTHADNNRDKIAHGTSRTGNRLTSNMATELRAYWHSGQFTKQQLADKYRISVRHLERVIKGDSW